MTNRDVLSTSERALEGRRGPVARSPSWSGQSDGGIYKKSIQAAPNALVIVIGYVNSNIS